MRIGYITYNNTPDNLRIPLEDNLIEISAKNSENHKLRINCWFSHDVTKFQTSEILILLKFYFHAV